MARFVRAIFSDCADTMKYALIADIHSNIEALDAVLAHAAAQGATRRVFLGDLIGYGPDPVAVVERVRACVAAGDHAVLGNHDAALRADEAESMNSEARAAMVWTRAQLDAAQTEFVSSLPLMLREDGMTWVHASAAAPAQWPYIRDGLQAQASMAAAATPWVFSGHVHEPALFYAGRDERITPFYPSEGIAIPVAAHRQWLAVVGACGQPRDQLVGARYALFDRAQCQLRFFRLPYDFHSTARKIRAAGLPERFALHVEGRV
ncbi:metallophosphoesterase family protein [Uliginosibacterium sediminicola]